MVRERSRQDKDRRRRARKEKEAKEKEAKEKELKEKELSEKETKEKEGKEKVPTDMLGPQSLLCVGYWIKPPSTHHQPATPLEQSRHNP